MELNYLEFKKDFYRYVKFLFGGGLSLILNLIITYTLTEGLHLWHMLSFTISLVLEMLFLFAYHSLITFRRKGKFLLFVIVISIISVLNWLAVYFLSVTLKIQYIVAIVISAGTISIVNYLVNRKVVFNDK